MNKKNAILWSIGLIVASSLNYTAANLLYIIWSLQLHYYLIMVFTLSLMIGIVALDITRSIISAYASMIVGYFITSTVFLAPYIMFAADVIRFNFAATVLFSFLARMFLISVVLYFLGALLGCVLGRRIADAFSSRHQISQSFNENQLDSSEPSLP